MREDGHISLRRLHELALLYLGLAKGTDDHLDDAESEEIAFKLRRWQPDQDPALIDHVLREAYLTFTNDPSRERLHDAVEQLAHAFPEELRLDIVQDLADIARADGFFDNDEVDYIRSLAEVWEVPLDPATTTPDQPA